MASGDHEPALDHGLVGPGPHHRGVGPSTEQEAQGLDQQGLTRSGLSGEGRHARLQGDGDVVDHAEVAHPELDQLGSHRLDVLAIGQVELGPKDGVEVRRSECDQSGRLVALPALHRRTGCQCGHGHAVHHQYRRAGLLYIQS